MTESTSPGESQHQNKSFGAQVGDAPSRAGEGKGGTPRLEQPEEPQAQPRSIAQGLGSEHTLLLYLLYSC